MPSSTFENLSEEKRAQILNTALIEFAANDYLNASITNLVRILGIAKGSIYQYFSNKRDLYYYLIELADNLHQDYLSRVKLLPEDNFFKWFREVQFASLEFERNHPKYAQLLKNAAQEWKTAELGTLALDLQESELTFYRKALKKQRKKSKKRKDTPIELQALVLAQVSKGLSSFYLGHRSGDSTEKKKKSPSRKAIKSSLKDLASILEQGVSD